jgi:KipI family sensor histidine kinase inhibitor
MADDATARRVAGLVSALAADLPGYVADLVPAFTTVAVFYEPLTVPTSRSFPSPQAVVERWIREAAERATSMDAPLGREIVLPVCYGGEFGPDLESVAAQCGLDRDEVIRRHAAGSYSVRAVGFTPGFAYLAGLPVELHTPRRTTPRVSVPVGSVGIGGAQTGVYPLASPGGWNLIGRTPRRLFDVASEPPNWLRSGDRVRFKPISADEFAALDEPASRPVAPVDSQGGRAPCAQVIHSGMQTTVQDLGRSGHQAVGVTVGGAMDREAAQVANWLVGNAGGAPVLEAVLTGPELRFTREALIAVTGGDVAGLPGWRPIRVRPGDVLDLRRIETGARLCVAVAGGWDVPAVLGGRGTHLRAGFGGFCGRALRAGDELGTGPVSLAAEAWLSDPESPVVAGWFITPRWRPPYSAAPRARIVRGPQAHGFCGEAWRRFLGEAYEVQGQSDRMGLRLAGPTLALGQPHEMPSESVAFGSVQVPPDGQPIVLLADRQTLGGYPKIANVVTVDLPLLAQLKPGDTVRFQEVDGVEAERLLFDRERALSGLRDSVARLLGAGPGALGRA